MSAYEYYGHDEVASKKEAEIRASIKKRASHQAGPSYWGEQRKNAADSLQQ